MNSILLDIRYAARLLFRAPGFTLAALLTLALGIGATTAVFSLVNTLLVRPLPFRDPGRLVWITNPVDGEGIPGTHRLANLNDWRERAQSFEDLGGYVGFSDRMNYVLLHHGEPERIEGAWVTRNLLDVLGVAPRLGRNFIEDDFVHNGPRSLILTDAFWRRRFQADPGMVGRSITISGGTWTIVGILPSSFDFSAVFTPGSRAVDFLRPVPNIRMDGFGNMMAVVGRLKPGKDPLAAQAELDVLNEQLRRAYPVRGNFGARVIALREQISGPFRRPFLALCCAVGCVLLIACVNLSNLLLARAVTRRQEIAVRMALGAGRGRLIRQMITESLLLALGGAALGLPLAYLVTGAVARSSAISVPLLSAARVDGVALAFTLIVALVAGCLFGIVPALQISERDVHDDLKQAGRSGNHGSRRTCLRKALVVSEVALACVLLVGAGLFIRSFARLLEVDLGFHPQQAASLRILTTADLPTQADTIAYFREVVRRVEAVPGVESAGMAASLPLGLNDIVTVRAQGQTYRVGEAPSAFLREVDPGYLHTMQIPLRAGRPFDGRDAAFDVKDSAATEEPVIINQKMAQRLWPGDGVIDGAIDKTFFIDLRDPPVTCKVIGIVGNVRQVPVEQEGGPEAYVLGWGHELVVRSKGALTSVIPDVRATLRKLDPKMPVQDFRPLEQIVDRVVSPKRLITVLIGAFALMALLLATIGIHGVLAYSTVQRTHEIGIRLALGAPRRVIVRLIVALGLRPVIVGLACGIAAALALTRIIRSLLFETTPFDPATFTLASVCLMLVALLACWAPALRASRVDPMIALRHD